MSANVTVILTRAEPRREPAGLDVAYRVTNTGSQPIWLVHDGWIGWIQSDNSIEVSLARGKMSAGSSVFGYFNPATLEIAPGASHSATLSLSWPLALDRLWNRESIADPAPGRYNFALRVGYGLTPAPRDPKLGESIETPVLQWQKETVSDAIAVELLNRKVIP